MDFCVIFPSDLTASIMLLPPCSCVDEDFLLAVEKFVSFYIHMFGETFMETWGKFLMKAATLTRARQVLEDLEDLCLVTINPQLPCDDLKIKCAIMVLLILQNPPITKTDPVWGLIQILNPTSEKTDLPSLGCFIQNKPKTLNKKKGMTNVFV